MLKILFAMAYALRHFFCELMCEWRGLWEDIEETDIDLWLVVSGSGGLGPGAASSSASSASRSPAVIGGALEAGAQQPRLSSNNNDLCWGWVVIDSCQAVASLTRMMGGDIGPGQGSLFRPDHRRPQCEPHPALPAERQTKRWSLHYNTDFYWTN